MSTRLALFYDYFIEAGWLAALVVTPLFFNLLSARTFEPDKAALLRILVLAILAALALVGIRDWRLRTGQASDNPQSSILNPLFFLALALGVILILSALVGLDPRLSLLGSYNRDQGVVTLLAYLALFLIVMARLRSPDQLDRLLDTVVLVSLPIGVYSLLQRVGVDPIPWGGYGAAVTSRVIGTQGNATFLGGYLALAIVITVYRWLTARRAGRGIQQGVYVTVLVIQALALVLSDSRGPALGLAAGLGVWALAYAAWRGQRRLTQIVVGVGVVGVLLVVILNLVGGALAGVPLLGRLGRLTDPTAGSNQVRVLVWQGMSDMILAHPERLPLGVGPDAIYLGYYPYFPVEARRLDNPLVGTHDRSHNEVLDRLGATGVLGLAAWLALAGGLLYYAVVWLDLATTAGQRRLLLLFLAAGAALGAILPLAIVGSLRYSGLGLGVGLILGLAVWLILGALREGTAETASDSHLFVIPMLLGALVTHLVEIQVGLPVTATQTLFWILAGALVAVGTRRLETGDWRLEGQNAANRPATVAAETSTKTTPKARRATRPTAPAQSPVSNPQSLLLGLVAGLALATLSYSFIVRGVPLPPALLVLVILGLVTLAAGAALVANPGLFLAAGGGVWVVYFIVHIMLGLSNANPGPTVFTLFVLGLLAWLGLFAILASRAEATRARSTAAPASSMPLRVVGIVLAVLLIVAIWPLALQPTYADMYVRIGQLYTQLGQWPQAIAAYEEATSRWPTEDFFLPNVAQAYLAQAQTASDPTSRKIAFDSARSTLQHAIELSPRNPEYLVNLGAAEQYWADKWATADEKPALQAQAADHYRQASELAPRDPHALRRWGKLALDQGQPAQAIPLLEKAIALLLPDGTTTAVAQTKQIASDTRADLARAYAATGRTADAVAQAKTALALAPQDAKSAVEDLLKQLGAGGS